MDIAEGQGGALRSPQTTEKHKPKTKGDTSVGRLHLLAQNGCKANANWVGQRFALFHIGYRLALHAKIQVRQISPRQQKLKLAIQNITAAHFVEKILPDLRDSFFAERLVLRFARNNQIYQFFLHGLDPFRARIHTKLIQSGKHPVAQIGIGAAKSAGSPVFPVQMLLLFLWRWIETAELFQRIRVGMLAGCAVAGEKCFLVFFYQVVLYKVLRITHGFLRANLVLCILYPGDRQTVFVYQGPHYNCVMFPETIADV